MKRYLLGIDVDTTVAKTLLFSAETQLLGHAYRQYPLHQPQVGRSEQNAEDRWQAVCEIVREVCADPADVYPSDQGELLTLIWCRLDGTVTPARIPTCG